MSLNGLLLCSPTPAIRPYLDTVEYGPQPQTLSPEVASTPVFLRVSWLKFYTPLFSPVRNICLTLSIFI